MKPLHAQKICGLAATEDTGLVMDNSHLAYQQGFPSPSQLLRASTVLSHSQAVTGPSDDANRHVQGSPLRCLPSQFQDDHAGLSSERCPEQYYPTAPCTACDRLHQQDARHSCFGILHGGVVMPSWGNKKFPDRFLHSCPTPLSKLPGHRWGDCSGTSHTSNSPCSSAV